MVQNHIVTRAVEFPVEGGNASGFEARPSCSGSCPAVVLIHEWWGLNDHIKDIASRLAQEGIFALAPDLYHGRVTTDAGQASQWMQQLDKDGAIRDLRGAARFLRDAEHISAQHIGAMGFCMGGSLALLLACREPLLKSAVAFYGAPPEPIDELKHIRCEVLFIGAGKDSWIDAAKIDTLKRAFTDYRIHGSVKVYPEAGHAFFNDTRPDAYNSGAAHDAWMRTIGLFNRTLRS